MINILFLAANPIDTQRLRLDEESRAIDDALQKTEFRHNFEIERHGAVRASDLPGLLLRHKPTIVHFSGHGSPTAEIILQDEHGHSHPVSGQWLKQLFALRKVDIKCVVLNACYSQTQAEAIADEIDCVIGIPQLVDDTAATKFATAFYEALGYGENVKAAFELALLQFALANPNAQDRPILIAKNVNPAEVCFAEDGLPSNTKTPQPFQTNPAETDGIITHSAKQPKPDITFKRLTRWLDHAAWAGIAGITGIAAFVLTLIGILPSPGDWFQLTALPITTTIQPPSKTPTVTQTVKAPTLAQPAAVIANTTTPTPTQILTPTDTPTLTSFPTVFGINTPISSEISQCKGIIVVPGAGHIAPLYYNPAVARPYATEKDIQEGIVVEIIDKHFITENEVMYKIVKENGVDGWLQQQYLNFDCPNLK